MPRLYYVCIMARQVSKLEYRTLIDPIQAIEGFKCEVSISQTGQLPKLV